MGLWDLDQAGDGCLPRCPLAALVMVVPGNPVREKIAGENRKKRAASLEPVHLCRAWAAPSEVKGYSLLRSGRTQSTHRIGRLEVLAALAAVCMPARVLSAHRDVTVTATAPRPCPLLLETQRDVGREGEGERAEAAPSISNHVARATSAVLLSAGSGSEVGQWPLGAKSWNLL